MGKLLPISRKDFESGLDARTKKVLDFLKSRPNEAFTSSEIAERLQMEQNLVIDLVNYLVHLEAVERTVIAGTYYYASLPGGGEGR